MSPEIWGIKPQNLQLPTYESRGTSTDQRFRVIPNYFRHLLLFYYYHYLSFKTVVRAVEARTERRN